MGLKKPSRKRLELICRILFEPYVTERLHLLFLKLYKLPQIFQCLLGLGNGLPQKWSIITRKDLILKYIYY